jgi:hypothetical protein
VNLLDSLLDAIVRLDGDALVMHVGEKPYVVTTSEGTNQFRGPLAWGQVELSTRVLTLDAVSGMLGQILPLDQRSALDEYGATEYNVAAANHPDERFTVVAARGGDDIWVEMRRQPTLSADAAAVIADLRHDDAVSVDEMPEPAAVEVSSPVQHVPEVPETPAPPVVVHPREDFPDLHEQPVVEPGFAPAAMAEAGVLAGMITELNPVMATQDMPLDDLPFSSLYAELDAGEAP